MAFAGAGWEKEKRKGKKKKRKKGLDPQASTGILGSRMKGRNPEQIWNGRVKRVELDCW
jgi:hypothetical protein